MSATLALLAPLALGLGASGTVHQLEDERQIFADVLVTSYVCDLLDYRVDYLAIADRGHETRERIMINTGATYDEALERMQSDVQVKRNWFNRTYRSALGRSGRINTTVENSVEPQFRFQKTFSDRCDDLAEASETNAFVSAPEKRISGAALSRKVRDLHINNRYRF